MNRLHYKTFIVLLLASTSTVLAADQPPNIVFVLADDLGYSDVGFNGQRFYETPNIDALARDGMILSDFYSGGPNCAPTRACINTGMYTPRHKLFTPGGQAKGDVKSMRFAVPTKGQEDPVYNTVDSMRNTIDGNHTSIAEVLGGAGYVSGRFSEKNDLAQKMPEKAKQLRAELMAWVKDTNAPVPTKPNPKFTK